MTAGTARTWAQRRRSDAYFPDTISPKARRLAEMRSVADYWRHRTGPDFGYALEPAAMLAIADSACHDLAAAIIAEGMQP